jgi:hypothetical protein
MRRLGSAAVGDGWHVGIVTASEAEAGVVLDVFGMATRRRFHTGRMAVPGGVTYLVATPPAGADGVTVALATLCARYDPAVVVLVGGGDGDVQLSGGQEPVTGAVAAFFSAAGEPATLPGFGGAAPFQVFRDDATGSEVPRFCAGLTTRRGKPLAWAVIRGVPVDAAQTLRYLIPYLRVRL